VRFVLDILAGVPTIVIGVFIFGLLVVGSGQTGWSAAIALAIVMVPIVARSSQEVLALVPQSLREAGLALGLRKWRIVLRIVLPTAAGGLITGAVLGVARVAGETAPLILLSSVWSNFGITTDPSQAMPNIPVTIFTLSESPSPSDHAQGWAAALLLILFVLTLSLVARTFHERSRRKMAG
jgi:phosphate transport system permease protein